MSFASQVKEELTRMPGGKSCCEKAILRGLMAGSGGMGLNSNGPYLFIANDNGHVAQKAYSLIREQYAQKADMERYELRRLNRHYHYRVTLSGPLTQRIYTDMQLSEQMLESMQAGDNCCAASFIRGMFLACGTVADPENSYQAEWVVGDEDKADGLLRTLKSHEINAKKTLRGGKFVVYLKYSEDIAALLAYMGAHQSMLKYEDVRAMKDLRNNVNRMVNFEQANLSKLSNASARQIYCIETLRRDGRFEKLPNELRQAANARLEYPEGSLNELAQALGISKSGVRHRLARIEEMAGYPVE